MFGHGIHDAAQRIHRFLFLEVPAEMAGFELILWEQSVWYPRDCPFKYVRQTPGEMQVGTLYTQVVKKPFPIKNTLEVTGFAPGRLIERSYRKGLLAGGIERITVEERSNGTRIDYDLTCTFSNPLKLNLWKIFFKKQFEQTIDSILRKLKDELLKKGNIKSDEGLGSV